MKNILPVAILGCIWGGSFALGYFVSQMVWQTSGLLWLAIIVFPFVYALSFVSIAGILSLIGQKGIVPGKFPRENSHPVYFLRRIYGLCWTQLYYFKPLYAIVLSIPLLKTYVFRLFGYRAHKDFTCYPDSWIRDLPLLSIRKGAYIANRSTLGTNLCTRDGQILVGPVRLGENSLVGHLSVIGTGATVGDGSEVGLGAVIGIQVKSKKNSKIGPTCAINHGVILGENSSIGSHSYVGLKAQIGPNIEIPAGSNIPAGSIIEKQEDLVKILQQQKEHALNYLDKINADIISFRSTTTTNV